MFFNGISEFESKFKLFDRLNSLVFNVWKDKKALAYRDSDIARITNEYRNYITRARSLSEQVSKLEQGLNQKYAEIERIDHEILDLCVNAQIKDCYIYRAHGYTTTQKEDGTPGNDIKTPEVRFVAKRGTEQAVAASMVGPCEHLVVNSEKQL